MAKRLNIYIVALLVMLFPITNSVAYCQIVKRDNNNYKIDDNIYKESVNSDRLPVDSINKKQHKFVSFVLKSLYNSSPSKFDENREESNFSTDEIYQIYNDLPIDSIIIVRHGVGGGLNENNRLERVANRITNSLHATTKNYTIRRNLIIKKGDKFSAETLTLAEYALRQSGYFTEVSIIPIYNPDSTISLRVTTQDKLTLGASIDYRKKVDGHISIYDNNFAGRGHRLEISEYFNVDRVKLYTAIGLNYKINNIFGKFINFRSGNLYGKDGRYKLDFELSRDFILPGDLAFGTGYLKQRMLNDYSILDSLYLTHEQHSYVWVGKSFRLDKRDNTPYITAGFYKDNYLDEPGSTEFTNPAFHDRELAIGSIGIYRENFYKTNMVYGFGYTENIPYGYKAEITGGYRWGEYGDHVYSGVSLSYGNRFFGGYINVDGALGLYYRNRYNDNNYRYVRNLNLYYISNLYPLRRGYNLRLFFKSSYISGEYMLDGERERIMFNSDYRVRGIGTHDVSGTTRLFNSFESVVFAPWHVLGFRFAMFTFADHGSLGLYNNPFRNDNFVTLGIGARIRNENLVFSTFEFRLSTTVKSDSPISRYWIEATSPSKVRVDRFIPTKPNVITYE